MELLKYEMLVAHGNLQRVGPGREVNHALLYPTYVISEKVNL